MHDVKTDRISLPAEGSAQGRGQKFDNAQFVVAREVHDEIPRHRFKLLQGLVDLDAPDAVEQRRDAVGGVPNACIDLSARLKAGHRSCEPF